MKILVTGGSGYKGSILVPKLVDNGHKVIVADPCWFGCYLKENENIKILKKSAADLTLEELESIDLAILLHSVANDPCSDLKPVLTWETACLVTTTLLRNLDKVNCKKIIYASSASVYGIRDELEITEELDPIAISVYNKTKVVAERIVLSYKDMNPTIIRPATVCGYSPRMRLDTVVNMLTMQAVKNKKITVLGGDQYRPNVHIDDLINAYLFFIDNSSINGTFNVGNDIKKVREIASSIQEYVPCEIVYKDSNDPRSYRLSSKKIESVGFKFEKNIDFAIKEVSERISRGELEDHDIYYNIKWMKKLKSN